MDVPDGRPARPDRLPARRQPLLARLVGGIQEGPDGLGEGLELLSPVGAVHGPIQEPISWRSGASRTPAPPPARSDRGGAGTAASSPARPPRCASAPAATRTRPAPPP